MDSDALAGMIFTLILLAMIGGFILLFPLSRRLGLLLESKLHEKGTASGTSPRELQAMREALHGLEAEVRRVAERQEFVERLIESRERQTLPTGDVNR